MSSQLTDRRVRHDDHYISVGCKNINECSKRGVSDLHALERGCQLAAAQLELFDDVADLLKPVHILVGLALTVGDHL